MIKISIIVTTYNRSNALALVLSALVAQENPLNFSFEVIIADDGSTQATAELIKQFQPRLPMQHIWQEDKGFRAAMARNRAIAASTGHYLIFLDGDCIPQTDFIVKHSKLAEKGWFVAGNRILLSEKFTTQTIRLSQKNTTLPFSEEKLGRIWTWPITQWFLPYLRRDINRLLPLLRLPDNFLRKYSQQKWQGAKTCNLALWREDILKINGFDERFQGWGHEDAELVVRLLRSGILRKEGRFSVPVLHLWHSEQDRHQEKANRQRLEQMLKSTTVIAQKGIKQYL
ncbi:glycosyltransferase family 2 protein, partial [Candidatus Parabeggiatoa sp. HSG14]|uniref:glycosyltransferase family 2 protein n=1 Tax=Candidatus Parabeggiatoa sp. HSG14 TaxID=3055593 RepID=UPI0025A7E94A|nr:glycosyltransferase family 2 protein [Thiotrichales bacterium HSG14]